MATGQTQAEPEDKPGEEPVSAPRFDFDNLAPDRDTVKLGGKLYEIRTLEDFGIVQQRELDRDGREFARLWNSEKELDEAEQARLKMLLDRIFDALLNAPKSVRGKFTDAQRARVVLDFSLAPLREMLLAQMQQMAAQTTQDQSTTTT